MLTKDKIDELIANGNWMIRFDNDGISYKEFFKNGI